MIANVTYLKSEGSHLWETEFRNLKSVLPPTDVTACWILTADRTVWYLSPKVVARVEVKAED